MVEELKKSGLFSDVTELDACIAVFIKSETANTLFEHRTLTGRIMDLKNKIKEIVGGRGRVRFEPIHLSPTEDLFDFDEEKEEGFNFVIYLTTQG